MQKVVILEIRKILDTTFQFHLRLYSLVFIVRNSLKIKFRIYFHCKLLKIKVVHTLRYV